MGSASYSKMVKERENQVLVIRSVTTPPLSLSLSLSLSPPPPPPPLSLYPYSLPLPTSPLHYPLSHNQIIHTVLLFFHLTSQYHSHQLMFQRGALMEPNMLNMEEYQDSEDARQFVQEMTGASPTNEPANKVSPTVAVQPFNRFAGAQMEATITIEVDADAARDGTQIYRASAMNGWSYVALDTQIIDGKAVAQTDQGGVFVAAAEVSTGVIVGLVVLAVIIIILILSAIGTTVYFVSKPQKWHSAKDRLVQTQNRLKRSFAKQV